MLEVFGIMMLCKANRKFALARGRKPGLYVALTIILWVGMEILGFVAGSLLDLKYGNFLIVYGFAGIGALISFLLAKFAPRGDYVDPNETNSPVAGTFNDPVNRSSYVPYQNQQFNNRPVDQYGMPVAQRLNEFGMPVDEKGNYSPVLDQYGVPVDTTAFVTQQPAQNTFAQPAPQAPQQPNFCGFCGARLEPGSKFCESCGAKSGDQ